MNIMLTRYQQLVDAIQGYQQTGTPLVAIHGTRMYPAGFGDDFGIYYFIPKLVSLFGLPLEKAINLFFAGMALLAAAVGMTGLFLLYRQRNQRSVAALILLGTSLYAINTGDVYSVSFFTALAVVPWVLLAARGLGSAASAYLVFPISSFFIALANTIRSHAGTGALLFVLIMLLSIVNIRARNKAVILVLMLIAAMGPHLFFNHVISQRNEYLMRHDASVENMDGKHPMWHSVYIGLGFIDNPYVEKYLDEVAIEKVRSISPGARFLSSEYSDILKRETVKIIREHPKFIIMNLAAKAGVIALYGVIFMNIGLAAARTWRKPLPIEIAFWAGLSLNAIFGLLVVPYTNYLLGFIAFASLYCIVSINYGLEGITVRAFIKEMVPGRQHICAE